MHLGITGEDLVREMIPRCRTRASCSSTRLGFGFANVVVAVPQAWIDVRHMADLDDVATAFRLKHERKMRLATKYANLTRGFFAEHGVVDYRIVESSRRDRRRAGGRHRRNDRRHHHDRRDARRQRPQGDRRRRHPALAGKPRRRADGGTGAPRSATPPASSSTASPRRNAPHAFCEVRTRFAGFNDTLLAARARNFGVASPFGGPTSSGMLTLHCPPENVHALASFLREHGAETVSVAALDYVYTRDNPLYAKLAAELDKPV